MPRRRGHALSARNDHWQGFPSANQPNNGADRDLPSQYKGRTRSETPFVLRWSATTGSHLENPGLYGESGSNVADDG